jgi:hypothetical protein
MNITAPSQFLGFREYPPTRAEVEEWRGLSKDAHYPAEDRANFAEFAAAMEAWIEAHASAPSAPVHPVDHIS